MTTSAVAMVPPTASDLSQTTSTCVQTLMRGHRRFVVVAPHPDDETLGVGGVMAALAKICTPVLLVAVTDGEASHAPGDWWTPARLLAMRPRESLQALHRLGLERPSVLRLRVADGAVAGAEATLTARLRDILREGDCVATTWQHDGHPDHEATGRAVLAASADVGCTCVQFPVWGRARALSDRPLPEPRRLLRIALDADAMRRKRSALAAYRSQLRADPSSGARPIVPAAMRKQCVNDGEVLLL